MGIILEGRALCKTLPAISPHCKLPSPPLSLPFFSHEVSDICMLPAIIMIRRVCKLGSRKGNMILCTRNNYWFRQEYFIVPLFFPAFSACSLNVPLVALEAPVRCKSISFWSPPFTRALARHVCLRGWGKSGRRQGSNFCPTIRIGAE